MTPFPLRAPVLMLHHVEPDPRQLDPAPLHRDSYLSRAELAALLDLLAARGCRTLTLAEAAELAASRRALPPRSVVLTFDDGCRCFRDHAWPELAARGMRATLFAVSGALGGTNSWDREGNGPAERREELLGAGDLRGLAAAGVEIGSHGRHHRDLARAGPGELGEEIAGSRDDLAGALGEPVRTFCYPYGRTSPAARAAVGGAGYLAAVSIAGAEGAREDDLLALARLPIRPGESRLELLLKVSRLYGAWSRLPRIGLLRALRKRQLGSREPGP
jgi:peptidoglycan/xylan/chitin deacetylase (PgdA/CDA1 family)